MPRVRSPARLGEIVDAATTVFGRSGFQLAQMTDIAAAAGVSVGTLYNYVEGKEALLLLCAENPFGGVAGDHTLPVPMLDRPALIAAVEATLAEQVRVPALESALARSSPVADARAELADIVSDLFDLLARSRRGADAMERCALDAPDLAELFYRGVRGRLLAQLSAYCTRIGADDRTALVSPESAARFALEVTTWWARHRHRDPEPLMIDEHEARNTAITLIVRALMGDAAG